MMREAGIYATDACLKHVFRNFDLDSNGTISAEELGTVIEGLRPATKKERSRFILRKCLKYVPMYLAVFNLVASVVGAKTNLRERKFGDLYGDPNHFNWAVAAVSDFIGNFGYVFLELSAKQESYEAQMLIVNRFLVCVQSQIPRYLSRSSLGIRGRKSLRRSLNEETEERHAQAARASTKESMNEGQGFKLLQKLIDDTGDRKFTELQLKRIFEKSDLYLSDNSFKKLFKRIKTRIPGVVTLTELLVFSKKMEKELYDTSEAENKIRVLKKALFSLSFYVSWLFTIGAIFWMLLVFSSTDDPKTIAQYLGLTCAFYLAAAIGSMVFHLKSTNASIEQVGYVDEILRKTAIVFAKNKAFSEKSSSLSRRTSVREYSIQRDSILDNARDLLNSSEIDNTLGKNTNNDKELQARGARALFNVLDLDQSVQLTEMELFSTLLTLGVLIPSNTFSTVYKTIDKSNDGLIQPEEFIDYVSNIKRSRHWLEVWRMTFFFISRSLSFYLIIIKVFAGSCQTTAAYGAWIDPDIRMNLFLMGSFGWAMGSFYLLTAFPRAKGQLFDLVESAKFMMKEAIEGQSLLHYAKKKSRDLEIGEEQNSVVIWGNEGKGATGNLSLRVGMDSANATTEIIEEEKEDTYSFDDHPPEDEDEADQRQVQVLEQKTISRIGMDGSVETFTLDSRNPS